MLTGTELPKVAECVNLIAAIVAVWRADNRRQHPGNRRQPRVNRLRQRGARATSEPQPSAGNCRGSLAPHPVAGRLIRVPTAPLLAAPWTRRATAEAGPLLTPRNAAALAGRPPPCRLVTQSPRSNDQKPSFRFWEKDL